ncbi:hypothetical protein C2S53_001333 [Perilla frutescens var. hirtella]|uniref:Peptidase S59 domain-containing protein n=1 Tax=Perilla frutescens var. hirtella TaxID=608512 RepID=A0AAD4P4G5_PERFH|nr:hypothetical protein C2S53_001333 [Perilla frutescens var. hirtella]
MIFNLTFLNAGFSGSTTSWGFASATGTGKECRGSRVAPYAATPDSDGLNGLNSAGKIASISAMPHYKDRTHEELRLEDYELCNGCPGTTVQKGSSFPIQNQGNAFQQSNSPFSPWPAPEPSSQSSFGSIFGKATAALVSDSSVKPPFGSTSTGFGVSPPFQFGDRDTRSHASGASSTQVFGFNSTPPTLPSISKHGCTSSVFGISNMPPFAPSSASSGSGTSTFRFPSAFEPERPSFSAFNVSTTPGFGITSTPLSWSTSPSAGSFFSGPKSNCNTIAPGTSNNPVSTTSWFNFSSTSASGIQASAAKDQGSGVASYSATREVDLSNDRYSGGIIQSISAMPSYKDKSHEELRSEDYGLCNTGGQKLCGRRFFGPFVEGSDTPNQSSVHSPFSPFKSSFSGPNRGNFITPSNTISTAPTLSPSVNRSQSQAFTSQPTTTSLRPTFNYTPSSIPITEPILKNSCEFPNISTAFTSTSAPLSNQSSVYSPFQPFKSSFSELKSGNFMTPSNTIFTAPTLSPSVNPLCCTNVFPSQSQAVSTLQPAAASFMPTFSPNLNPPSLIPFTEPVLKNSCECSKVPATFTSASLGAFSLAKPSVIVSPSIQSTSVTASDPWPSISKASQPQQTAENVGPPSTNDLNKPSASSGLTTVEFTTSHNINGQWYVPSRTLSVESSPVVNPFATQFPVDQHNAVTSRQHGISSLPVSNNLSSNRRTSLLRIRHVSSRQPGLPTQKHNGRSSETKVPFFINEEDRPIPVAPFLPRENPRAWVNISLSLCSPQISRKGDDEVNENSTSLTDDEDKQHEDDAAARTDERRVADVLALLPKLPDGEYYTEPSLHELAAKEMAEAGYCRHVKDFVVGRKGYGSIKFLGETDVRHLDISSAVQFNNREMIVYPDERKKPEVGQQLNKAAEVSILNVKCINKKTGKQYVQGHQVESYQEILINKTLQQGAEFVSYDPLQGEWKFRVQHF